MKIDLDNLDLNRVYTFKEFEFINNELKTHTLVIDGRPVNLFELNKNGKLIPMTQSPISMEAAVAEIARQLGNWNIQTFQDGIITTSQGGFNFARSNIENDDKDNNKDDNEDDNKDVNKDVNKNNNEVNVGEEVDIGGRKIKAPDVAFTPNKIYCELDQQQLWTFKGDPFTPEFVVEVGDVGTNTINSKFNTADKRIKDEYLAAGTSVNLAWLIDPKNKQIIIYKRGQNCKSYRSWKDISGNDSLPGFTLRVSLINYVLTQKSSENNEGNEEEGKEKEKEKEREEEEEKDNNNHDGLEIRCPLCEKEFDNHYNFLQHYEMKHVFQL